MPDLSISKLNGHGINHPHHMGQRRHYILSRYLTYFSVIIGIGTLEYIFIEKWSPSYELIKFKYNYTYPFYKHHMCKLMNIWFITKWSRCSHNDFLVGHILLRTMINNGVSGPLIEEKKFKIILISWILLQTSSRNMTKEWFQFC